MDITKKNLKESKLQILKKYYKGSLDNKKEEIKDIESQEKKEVLTKQNIRFLFFSICSLITYALVIRKLFRKEEFLVS